MIQLHVTVEDRVRLVELSRLVSVEDVENGVATVSVLHEQLSLLRSAGFRYRKIPAPKTTAVQMCSEGWEEQAEPNWDCYPTYYQYDALMQRLAAEFPDICHLEDLGPSANQMNPHRLLALKITDHPDFEEVEPEVFLTSTMHGDETAGYVLLLRLAFNLLTSYESDPITTDLVDDTEIWINPLANPDGTYYGGDSTVGSAIRFFTTEDGRPTSVDPNRNFPDRFLGRFPFGRPWWPETEAMMAFAANHTIVLSANLHGGAELVNYPWDSDCERHPDDAWFRDLSLAWAQSAQENGPTGYLDDCKPPRCSNAPCIPGVTNGADWYQINGGRQDYMTFFRGGREVTVELSSEKLLSTSRLEELWQANRRAVLDFIGAAQIGIHGTVTDFSGRPLSATVVLLNHDTSQSRSWVRTDPDAGDFHRLTLPGVYDVAISAAGRKTIVLDNIIVSVENPSTLVEVQLPIMPDSGSQGDFSVW
ncbi:MAG: carboxypeptidase regulatory-like domain-containing protein [Thermoanaerobaculales bacterium]|nr:carboxypeptidase regulatory-like domain-containing protein [Thermoanaerobaculales bacterium]